MCHCSGIIAVKVAWIIAIPIRCGRPIMIWKQGVNTKFESQCQQYGRARGIKRAFGSASANMLLLQWWCADSKNYSNIGKGSVFSNAAPSLLFFPSTPIMSISLRQQYTRQSHLRQNGHSHYWVIEGEHQNENFSISLSTSPGVVLFFPLRYQSRLPLPLSIILFRAYARAEASATRAWSMLLPIQSSNDG